MVGSLPTRIQILMYSDMSSEPRVLRQARSLTDSGYEVIGSGVRTNREQKKWANLDCIRVRRSIFWDQRLVEFSREALRKVLKTTAAVKSSSSKRMHSSVGNSRKWDVKGDLRNLLHLAISFLVFFRASFSRNSDLYWVHDPPPAMAAVLVAKMRKKPLIYESHEYWAKKNSNRLLSHWIVLKIEKYICKKADLVIVVNDYIAICMADDYLIQKPLVILNVPDVEPIEEVNSESLPLRVLYHGAVEENRGVDHLVEAIGQANEQVELLIRGDGKWLNNAKSLVSELDLTDIVRFEPPVDVHLIVEAASYSHVGVCYGDAAAGYEWALPNKVFEYMAAGLVVVASDFIELRHLIESTGCGVLLTPGDSTALAKAFDELALDFKKVRKCRNASLTAARTYYIWPIQSKILLDAVGEVLKYNHGK